MSWRALDPVDGDGEIRRRLLAPERAVSLAELAAIWSRHTIEVRLKGLGRLVADPALAGKVRGAFGTALMAGASAEAIDGEPCSFDPPSAFEVLFRKQGRLTPGLDLPGPWVLGIDAKRNDLVVSLSLFGFAIEWSPAAAEALTRALRDLVAWPPVIGKKAPVVEIVARRATTDVGHDVIRPQGSVEIALLSPLVLTGRDVRSQPESLITGLGTRISGLARWHDVAIDDSVDWAALKSDAASLTYDITDAAPVRWNRGSNRQGRVIPMSGLMGRLTITGEISPDIALLLTLGATCAAGADTAMGCGRYRVVS